MKQKIFYLTISLTICLLSFSIMLPCEQESCSLHTFPSGDAPLLLNTNSGEIIQVQIFDSRGPNAEYGIIRSGGGEGVHIFIFPDDGYADVTVEHRYFDEYSFSAAARFYCGTCLKAFAELDPTYGFLITDGKKDIYGSLESVESADGLTLGNYRLVMAEKSRESVYFRVLYSP